MRRLTDALLILGLTAAYIGAARVGLFLQYHYAGVAPLWPSAGLGLVLVWLYGRRFVAVIFLGEIGIALWLGQGWLAGIAGGFIEILEAALATWLLSALKVTPKFERIRDIALFIVLGAIVPATLASLAGAGELLSNAIITSDDYWVSAWTWGLGDALGILIVAPLIIQWIDGWPFTRRREAISWVVIMLVTLGLGVSIMLAVDMPRGLFFLLLPLVVVGALTSGMVGASGVAAVLAICVLGLNLSQANDSFTIAVRMLFVGTAAVTGYLLAVALAERQRANELLAREARRDSLTRLANRVAFDTALKQVAATPGTHLVLYLDIDHFQLLNDSCGHDMGDRFLAGLAEELSVVVPSNVLLARLGGDEFGVLWADTDADAADRLAETLRQTVASYRYVEDGAKYRVTVSIGKTLFDRGEHPAAVFSRADIACYVAKREGRNRVQRYQADDPALRANRLEIQRVSQIHDALADGSFTLVRQLIAPIIGETEGGPPFYEILLRLKDARGELHAPGAFIDVATRYGMMPTVDRWVIEQSFRYRASVAEPMRLSINLFGVTLNDPTLFDDVLALAKQYDINPADICFEVTETVAIQRLTHAIGTMERLVSAGFTFSLDDFGAGVASFGFLQELPVAYVKIDGRFIRDIKRDPANQVIVESLVKLAAVKHIGCIGEWIENGEILDLVKGLGVGFGQGFYLHKPELLPGDVLPDRAVG